MRRALITGITGQDGSYLAELLLSRGYEVHGVMRRSSSLNTSRIDHLYQDPHDPSAAMRLHYGDLTDGASLRSIVATARPDEVYNLAAQSHVRVSFDMPEYTHEVVAMGTVRLLEAVREVMGPAHCRVYQASSSEQYGRSPPPQNEATPFRPISPYAAAKCAAHQSARMYRDVYGMHVSCGILFNHEGERRGETFVSRKITRAATRISLGLQDKLYLGNLNAKRDWGYAGDFCEAMWMMLQQDEPDDYVIATGQSHTVRDFLDMTFTRLNLHWQDYVEIDPRYFRPAEVDALCGDSTKAFVRLGWKPRTHLDALVALMVDSDLALARREAILRDAAA